MKSVLKKSLLFALACVFMVLEISAFTADAQAKTIRKKSPYSGEHLYCAGSKINAGYVPVGDMVPGGKVSSVKSSNTKVIKVYKNKAYPYGYDYKTVGLGRATLTITVKKGKDKYIITENVIVRPYTNPLASLKMNGKEIVRKFDKNYHYEVKFKKNQKIDLKAVPKKGWTAPKISAWKPGDKMAKDVIAGKKITIKKKKSQIYLNFIRTDGGEETRHLAILFTK